MSDRHTSAQQRDWEELAQLDPEWAILSSPGKRHGGWEHDEFFATGVEQVGALIAGTGARVVRLPTAARSNRSLASLHYVTKDSRV